MSYIPENSIQGLPTDIWHHIVNDHRNDTLGLLSIVDCSKTCRTLYATISRFFPFIKTQTTEAISFVRFWNGKLLLTSSHDIAQDDEYKRFACALRMRCSIRSVCDQHKDRTWDIKQTQAWVRQEKIYRRFHLFPYVSCKQKKLNSIPSQISLFSHVKELNLAFNNISSFPDDFWKLNTLDKLVLQHNKLSHIPEDITKLTNLSGIDISHNEFESIPLAILNLENFRSLLINNNQIQEVPNEFSDKTHFHLDVSKNLIESPSQVFLRLFGEGEYLEEGFLDENYKPKNVYYFQHIEVTLICDDMDKKAVINKIEDNV